jgi:citrate synthase
MTMAAGPKAGLEDTIATSSSICYVDGDRGVLAYRGYDIHDLARHSTFEEVCYLLWHGRLPTRAELGDLQSQLAGARALPEPLIRLMRSLPAGDSMDALRTLTSALAHYDPDVADASPQANYRKAVRLTAQIGTLVAALGRVNGGAGPIQPDPVLGHAANFLYMLTGERPSAVAARAFDVALILHADHELNASTFAARVAAATLADMHSAIVAAIATLKGPLHGGANADVMRMLLEIGATSPPERAEEIVRGRLARKEKIPGFGHRVYHTEDPRATDLRQMSRDLGQRAGQPVWSTCHNAIEVPRQEREEAQPECRFLFGVHLLRARHPDRALHADLRGQPGVWLDCPRPRAVRPQPSDSASCGTIRDRGTRSDISRSSSDSVGPSRVSEPPRPRHHRYGFSVHP